MDRAYKAWQSVKGVLAVRAAAHAFVLCEDVAHPEAFGSRYAVFKRGATAFRLIWDGKDERYLLETNQDMNGKRLQADWQQIYLVSFSPADASQSGDTVLAGLAPAVERFLATFRDEPARRLWIPKGSIAASAASPLSCDPRGAQKRPIAWGF